MTKVAYGEARRRLTLHVPHTHNGPIKTIAQLQLAWQKRRSSWATHGKHLLEGRDECVLPDRCRLSIICMKFVIVTLEKFAKMRTCREEIKTVNQ